MTSSISASSATRASFCSGDRSSRRPAETRCFRRRQRIKQRARLEDHGHAAANLGQLVFGPIGDVLAGHEHAPGIRPQESQDVLQRDRFPHAAAPHDHARLPRVDVEADIIQHQVIVKALLTLRNSM